MARREYSDEDKATALAALNANGGNVHRTAKDLGIPRATLARWSQGVAINSNVSNLEQHKKRVLADELEEIAQQLAGALAGKMAEASLQQTATSLGIVIDKMQLLRGKPTAINEEVTDARDRLAHLVNRFAARSGESSDSSGTDG